MTNKLRKINFCLLAERFSKKSSKKKGVLTGPLALSQLPHGKGSCPSPRWWTSRNAWVCESKSSY